MNDRGMMMFVLAVVAVMGIAAGASAEEESAGNGTAEGEKTYQKFCRGCHKLTDQVSKGPGFQGVTSRHSDSWLDKWIQNPKAVIESGDPDAKKLKEKFNITMPTIKALADEKTRREVIDFLKENDKNQPSN